MFDAREWLESVTDAVRSIEADAIMLNAARERLESLGAVIKEVVVRSSASDPMDKVDDVLVLEAERESRIAHAMQEVNEARLVFEGMRRIGKMESNAADALELVHVMDLTKKAAGKRLGVSRTTLISRYAYGVNWLDAHGLAYAKAGLGRAT